MSAPNAEIQKKSPLLVRAARAVWFAASAIVLPTTWKKLRVFVGLHAVLHPVTLLLFPRVETVLKEQGLDPALKEKLAPRTAAVYVRKDNIWGKIHTAFDRPLLLNVPYIREIFAKETEIAGLHRFNYIAHGLYLRDQPEEIYNTSGITAADKNRIVLLHELRHCSRENDQKETSFAKELDADSAAVFTLQAAFNKSSYIDFIIEQRNLAGTDNKNYNSALYFDALKNGRHPPAIADMLSANAEAAPLTRLYQDTFFDIHHGLIDEAEASRRADKLIEMKKNISPLGRERFTLFTRSFDKKISLMRAR